MMMQLHESTKEKKSPRIGKKKHALISSESLEDKEDAICIELSSKHSKSSDNGEGGSQHINGLKQFHIVVVNRRKLQDTGCDWPYPMEWDSVCYPRKFNPLTLHQFNGKGSPNQHIYHFISQIGNIATNDVLLKRLFIASLKDLAFDWFMRL